MDEKRIFSTKSLLMAGTAVFFCDLHSGPPPKAHSDVPIGAAILEKRIEEDEFDDRLKRGEL